MRRSTVAWLLLYGSVLMTETIDAEPKFLDDKYLQQMVRTTLNQNGFQALNVRSEDGLIVLSGQVASTKEKLLALEAVLGVSGIEAIESEISVRLSSTQNVEEAIWLRLLHEEIADSVESLLVKNRVANVVGKAPDERTRKRVIEAIQGVKGVDEITNSIEIVQTRALESSTEAAKPFNPELRNTPVTESESKSRSLVNKTSPISENIMALITQHIISSPDYTVFDQIQLTTNDRVITLLGSVTSEEKKTNINEMVTTILEGQKLHNMLHVLPNSASVKRLRQKLFSRIYEDPTFHKYKEFVNLPIHIVVNSKAVTLTGIVETEIERMAVEAIVRTTFGVRSVTNQLRIRK